MKGETENPESAVSYTINLVDVSRKTYERNGIETIDSNGILLLNEKHVEDELMN